MIDLTSCLCLYWTSFFVQSHHKFCCPSLFLSWKSFTKKSLAFLLWTLSFRESNLSYAAIRKSRHDDCPQKYSCEATGKRKCPRIPHHRQNMESSSPLGCADMMPEIPRDPLIPPYLLLMATSYKTLYAQLSQIRIPWLSILFLFEAEKESGTGMKIPGFYIIKIFWGLFSTSNCHLMDCYSSTNMGKGFLLP